MDLKPLKIGNFREPTVVVRWSQIFSVAGLLEVKRCEETQTAVL